MEVLVYSLVPVLMFAIWRAEQVDKARLEAEQIRWDKDYRLKTEQAERNEYIVEIYREIFKHVKD